MGKAIPAGTQTEKERIKLVAPVREILKAVDKRCRRREPELSYGHPITQDLGHEGGCGAARVLPRG